MSDILSLGGRNPSDIPVIETARLRLRSHRVEDLAPLSTMWGDTETVRFIGAQTRTRQDIWKQIQRTIGGWALLGYGYWVVADRQTDTFVGEVGFLEGLRDITPAFTGTPEAGWVFQRAVWGQGYASEAVTAALAWGDDHFPGKRSACIIEPDHTASIRIAEKVGFKPAYDSLIGEEPIRVFFRTGP